jgi:hypothetical protein
MMTLDALATCLFFCKSSVFNSSVFVWLFESPKPSSFYSSICSLVVIISLRSPLLFDVLEIGVFLGIDALLLVAVCGLAGFLVWDVGRLLSSGFFYLTPTLGTFYFYSFLGSLVAAGDLSAGDH